MASCFFSGPLSPFGERVRVKAAFDSCEKEENPHPDPLPGRERELE